MSGSLYSVGILGSQPVRLELSCPIRPDQLTRFGQYTLRQRILPVAYYLDFNTTFDPTPAFACNPFFTGSYNI
jgi:hypothetical protein